MTKTEIKSAAKQTLTEVRTEIGNLLTQYGRLEVSIGAQLDIMRETFLAAKAADVDLSALNVGGTVGTMDWRQYAAVLVPGRSAPTLYRWTNAGHVARFIGDVPAAVTVGRLVPLYRILAEANGEEEVAAAKDLIRETWKDLTKGGKLPTEEEVLAAAERVQPTNRGGSGSGSSDAAPAAEETAPAAETANEAAPAASSPVQVDPVAVEAARTNWSPVQRQLVETHKQLTPEAVSAVSLAVLRFAAEHGVSTMQAVFAAPAAETN